MAYGKKPSLPVGTTSIAPQANIKTNVGVPPNLLEIRRNMVRMAAEGDIVIEPSSVNAGGLAILNEEIVVAERSMLTPGNKMSAFNILGFTSFAGFTFSGSSQDEWEDQFVILGTSTSKFDPTGDAPSNDGISCRKKGSGTIINTSDEIIYPGDVLAAQIPYLDPAERVKQYAVLNSLSIPGTQSPFPKPIATIKKVTYADTAKVFRGVAETLVRDNNKLSVPSFSSRVRSSPYADSISRAQQLATTLKMYNGAAGLSMVTSMMQHGYLVPTCRAFSNPLDVDTDLAQWKQSIRLLEKNGMSASNRTQWIAGPSSDQEIREFYADFRRLPQSTSESEEVRFVRFFKSRAVNWSGQFVEIAEVDVERRKISLESQIGALSIIAGVSADLTKKRGLNENTELTQYNNTRILFGSLAGLKNYATLKRIFFDTAGSTSTVRLNGLGTTIDGIKTPLAQLHTVYMEAAPMLCHLMGRSFDSVYKFAMFTATSTSAQGEPVNYA